MRSTGMLRMFQVQGAMLGAVLLLSSTAAFPGAWAQASGAPAATAPASGVPRQSGTIKAVTPRDLVLTNAAGQDFAVNVPAAVRVLLVDPVTRDLKSAQPGTVSDIAAGDKAIISGTVGDTGQTLTATRILLLKSGAIAAMHAQEQAAWAHSTGGIVRTVDSAAGTLTVLNGTRTYTINTTPNTVVRRYAAGSVRFADAQKSTVAAIQPGDQVQVRGQRSPDGMTVAAEELVTGSFANLSGVLTAVDATAGRVSLRDLATKQPVTVLVSEQSNLRKLPVGFGQTGAGPGGAPAGATTTQGTSGGAETARNNAGSAPAGGGERSGPGAGRGAGGARQLDLSRIIGRLPTETVADLKPGDAVMIVASKSADGGSDTAITLVSGVERILAASPSGATTLSPWSLGGGEGEGGGEGAGGGER